jgi:hypothetical protein
MVFEINENEVLCSFILDYTDNCLSPAEEKSFSELMKRDRSVYRSVCSSRSIKKLLTTLPEIKAKPSFDQKMAAAFALELEREAVCANQKRIRDKAFIS